MQLNKQSCEILKKYIIDFFNKKTVFYIYERGYREKTIKV